MKHDGLFNRDPEEFVADAMPISVNFIDEFRREARWMKFAYALPVGSRLNDQQKPPIATEE